MLLSESSKIQVCFVIGKPRSGTTVLKKMLETHPKVMNFGEIFREDGENSFFSFLRRLVADDSTWLLPSRRTNAFLRYIEYCREKAVFYKADATAIILDVKYDQSHLVYDDWRDLNSLPAFFRLIRDNRWRVIDLQRRNILSMIVSNEIAIKTKVYHSTASYDPRSDIKLRLDPWDIERRLKGIRKTYARISTFFSNHEFYVRLFYEDLFDQDTKFFRADILTAMSSFLDLEKLFDPQPKLQKLLRPDPLSYIDNADEIRALLTRLDALPPDK